MTLGPYTFEDGRNRRPMLRILLVLAILGLGFQYQRQAWPFCKCFGGIQDEQQRDYKTEPDRDLDLNGSYLVVVEESEARGVERIRILNDYEFWFGLRDRGLKGFRILDPDSPDANSFVREAARHSISPPFVMHVSGEGKVLATIEFPNNVAQINEMLK